MLLELSLRLLDHSFPWAEQRASLFLSGNASAWQGCVLGLLHLAHKLKSLLSGWVCFTLGVAMGCVQFQGELSLFLLEKGWALLFLSPDGDSTCSCPSPGKDRFSSSPPALLLSPLSPLCPR